MLWKLHFHFQRQRKRSRWFIWLCFLSIGNIQWNRVYQRDWNWKESVRRKIEEWGAIEIDWEDQRTLLNTIRRVRV